MERNVTLKLSRNFVGQIIDCLSVAIDDWHRTKIYHEDGIINPEESYIRECTDANEAEQINNYYKEILAEIEKQLEHQGG